MLLEANDRKMMHNKICKVADYYKFCRLLIFFNCQCGCKSTLYMIKFSIYSLSLHAEIKGWWLWHVQFYYT